MKECKSNVSNKNNHAADGNTNNDAKYSTNDITYHNTDNDIDGTNKNNNNDKRNNRFSSQQPKETVFILGDSIIKKVNSFLLKRII